MTDEGFTAFYVLLAAIGLPSVSLLFAGAWELWQCGTMAEGRRGRTNLTKELNDDQ